MTVDPQVQMLLDGMKALGVELYTPGMTPQDMRDAMGANAAPVPGPEMASTEDRVITVGGGIELPVRIYRPVEATGPQPVVVFFHGGGWVIGNIESHDNTVRALAHQTGAVCVSVDYRLAPEHRFPAAAEDCYGATVWVAEHADELGVDRHRIAVAGDSAGGNLAAVVALMARDRAHPTVAFQALIYPCTDMNPDSWPSMRDNAEGMFLTTESMRWFYGHYAADEHRTDPYASPYHAPDLSGLPPAIVITAEYDPLRDEGEAYAQRLAEAGVPVDCRRYDGMIHGFFGMTAMIDRAKDAQADVALAIRTALGA
jgi:acetyl esterase